MPDQLAGVIERITFHNLDSGYCVLRVRAAGHRDPVTVVGHLPQAVAGEYVDATGEWVNDRSFGTQFKAAGLQTHPPHTPEGIAKYLGSGLVRGIGPKYAKRIVELFGDKTIEVIENSVSRLAEVKGIGKKRIDLIRQSWHQSRGVRDIMTFLMSYGVGTARAVRIYKAYGDSAIRLIQENPYRLSADIWGVGFRTADELALKLGLPRDAPQRVQAAVRHVLTEASGTRGHVAMPEPILVEETASLTQATPEQVDEAISALRATNEVVRDILDQGSVDPGLSGEPLLYLMPLFLAELGVARQVAALRSGPAPLPGTDVDAALAWAEGRMGLAFAGSQRAAVRAAVTEKFLVLTGGPGTGKTTIVRAVLDIVTAKSLRVLLAAPTGRAAKRLTESTGREAKTIHRVLEFDAGTNAFRRNKENPLDLDLLVVDETSMVDVVLMNKLLQAVPPWAGVLLVGDVDQLPSVGPGGVLRDLIDSRAVPVARLTEVHRQAGGSHIVRAAHAINRGDEPESAPAGTGDFYFIEADDPATVIDRILTVVRDRIPAKFGLDPVRDVQVLSPMNKSDLGVQNLNRVLQEAVNPAAGGAAEVGRFGSTFRAGDKVIQTRNNYQREVFNGDIGRVTALDTVDQVLTVEFDGKPVEYEFADLDELQLAYAVTVHKCVAGYGRAAVPGRGLVPVRAVEAGDAVRTGRGDSREVLAHVATGHRPVVRVRTRCGYAIDVSEEHPLLVADGSTGPHFRRAGDLAPGAFACIDRSVVPGGPVPLPEVVYDRTQKPQKRLAPPTVVDAAFAWALGVIVGDGCCRDRRDGLIDVTSQDAELVTAYRAVFERMGLTVTVRPVRGRLCRVYFCSLPLRRWLERLGLGHQLAAEKIVPGVIWVADEISRGAFLRGLFDTDGSVGTSSVRFTSASVRLAAEVQELLLSLGVVAVRSSQGERHYKVAVSGTAVPAFAARVGFTVPYKSDRLATLVERSARGAGKTNIDVIPFGAGLMRRLRALLPSARGVRGRGLFANRDGAASFVLAVRRGVSRMTYAHLRRVAGMLAAGGQVLPPDAAEILRENHFFDPIVSVERLPTTAEMYDLEVQGQHSFVVNGFVCHNSQGSEYPAVVVPVHTQHWVMLQRNLLYTAVTRGRKLVVLVGKRYALHRAVQTADTNRRFGMLAERLRKMAGVPPAAGSGL